MEFSPRGSFEPLTDMVGGRFEQTGEAYCGSESPCSAGNGSIMRLAPVVLFYHPDTEDVDRYAADSSRTTHGAAEAVAACRILAAILHALLSGASKEDALGAMEPADWMSERLQAIAGGSYMGRDLSEIRGTGYVVDSVEAALWCFHRTGSFEEAVLTAANLGDDADTTAAVCGQLAGACYGTEWIPEQWLDRLVMRETIEAWADHIHFAGRLEPSSSTQWSNTRGWSRPWRCSRSFSTPTFPWMGRRPWTQRSPSWRDAWTRLGPSKRPR